MTQPPKCTNCGALVRRKPRIKSAREAGLCTRCTRAKIVADGLARFFDAETRAKL